MVVETSKPGQEYCSNGQGQLYGGYSHRRQRYFRMGWSQLQGVFCTGQVVRCTEGVAHKPQGVGFSRILSPGAHVDGRSCQPLCGQQNNSCIYKPPRRYQVKGSVPKIKEVVDYCAGSGRLGQGSLDTKGGERDGRHALQDQHIGLGAAVVSRGGNHALAEMVCSSSRPVCKPRLPSSSQVLLFPARQDGFGEGLLQSVPVAGQVLCLPTSSVDQHDIGQNAQRQGQVSNSDSSSVACISVVDETSTSAAGTSFSSSSLQHNLDIPSGAQSSLSEPSGSMSAIRQYSLLSKEAEALLQSDIRTGTQKIYMSRFAQFRLYCADVGVNPHTCPEDIIVNFLTILSSMHNFSYSTINGYRSAISRYHIGFGLLSAGSAKKVRRVTKAVFNVNPPLPRYSAIWDVEILVSHLETMHPPESLSLFDLGAKTLSLISLSSISRSSTVSLLAPDFTLQGDTIIFFITGLEKQARPGHIRTEVRIPAALSGSDKASLNTLHYLQHYLRETESHRDYFEAAEGYRPKGLFIANTKVSLLKFLII